MIISNRENWFYVVDNILKMSQTSVFKHNLQSILESNE